MAYSIVSECLENFSNFLRISRAHISKSKRGFNVKSSTDYFHMTTKILADFEICIIVPLKLNDSESVTLLLAYLCNIIINSLFLNNYQSTLKSCTLVLITTSKSFAWTICVLFCSLMWLVNKVQFLNITYLFLSSGSLAVVSAPVLVVIVPRKSIYALIQPNEFNFKILILNLIWQLIPLSLQLSISIIS